MDENEKAEAKRRETVVSLYDTQMNKAVSALLATADGRTFISYLLEISKVEQSSYTGNALGSAFTAGEINVGLQIKGELIARDPAGYVNFMRENLNV